MLRRSFALVSLVCAVLVAGSLPAAAAPMPGDAAGTSPLRQAVATGFGGAVSTVDPDATAVGIDVLRHGGNAVDAAIAAVATLGVTEPFVSGPGSGGFLVY